MVESSLRSSLSLNPAWAYENFPGVCLNKKAGLKKLRQTGLNFFNPAFVIQPSTFFLTARSHRDINYQICAGAGKYIEFAVRSQSYREVAVEDFIGYPVGRSYQWPGWGVAGPQCQEAIRRIVDYSRVANDGLGGCADGAGTARQLRLFDTGLKRESWCEAAIGARTGVQQPCWRWQRSEEQALPVHINRIGAVITMHVNYQIGLSYRKDFELTGWRQSKGKRRV